MAARFVVVGWLVALFGAPVGAADVAPKAVPPSISATQLTLRLDAVQGQATVIEEADATLTVVTAAHFLTPADVGKTLAIHHQNGNLKGAVAAVATNPGYRAFRSRMLPASATYGTLGVDTAIADIRVELPTPQARALFEAIEPAGLTAHPIPLGRDRILSVRIVDQFGAEHTVRAGNHLNPKCLAWGRRSYDVRRGDSGAGVFLLAKTPEGAAAPILIGNVSQVDDRGGIASLIDPHADWVEKALAGLRSRPK